MAAIVKVRRARTGHECSYCGEEIQRGDLYESASLPPDSDIGNTTWWRSASHVGAYLRSARQATKADYDRLGIGCDEAAAYRDDAERAATAELELEADHA